MSAVEIEMQDSRRSRVGDAVAIALMLHGADKTAQLIADALDADQVRELRDGIAAVCDPVDEPAAKKSTSASPWFARRAIGCDGWSIAHEHTDDVLATGLSITSAESITGELHDACAEIERLTRERDEAREEADGLRHDFQVAESEAIKERERASFHAARSEEADEAIERIYLAAVREMNR